MPPQPTHVVFIHGLANKPKKQDLERIWLEALSLPVTGDEGFDLGASGVTSAFTYWADLFYSEPLPAAGYEANVGTPGEVEASVSQDLPMVDNTWSRALRGRYPEDLEHEPDPPIDSGVSGFERVPIPWFIKKKVMAHFIREAHDYLFNVDGLRDTIRDRVMADLNSVPPGTRRVLVGHSQGSFIAYDVLTGVGACPAVDGLLTCGSPLGVDEVQDKLVWSRSNGFPATLTGGWVNVYDPLDMVARADPRLSNDFLRNGLPAVEDIEESNWGTWRHSATKYLKGPRLREALRRLCGREGA